MWPTVAEGNLPGDRNRSNPVSVLRGTRLSRRILPAKTLNARGASALSGPLSDIIHSRDPQWKRSSMKTCLIVTGVKACNLAKILYLRSA